MNKVVVTGLGSLSSLGGDVETFWSALTAGVPGLRPLEDIPGGLSSTRIGGQVPEFRPEEHFSPSLLPFLDRHSQFALIAAQQAVADAGLSKPDLSLAAAVIGTGCGGKDTDEETYCKLYKEEKRRVHPLTIPRGMPSAAASQVSMQLGIKGPVFTVSSACSSSNHAIAQAAMMIQSGLVEVAIAGGADAPFTYGLLKAWEAMRVLSRDTCRPFSADRSGLVLGEGAGVVVLESQRHAERRDAGIYAELAGYGMSADAGHITDPSAEGAARAISAALANAGVAAADVDYVNAHGTATRANDISETKALRMVFGTHADALAVSSTKSMHGHALGASGGLELVATIKALETGMAPGTANFNVPDADCDLDYLPNQARKTKIDTAISNSFAFGGLNAVLVVRSV